MTGATSTLRIPGSGGGGGARSRTELFAAEISASGTSVTVTIGARPLRRQRAQTDAIRKRILGWLLRRVGRRRGWWDWRDRFGRVERRQRRWNRRSRSVGRHGHSSRRLSVEFDDGDYLRGRGGSECVE